MGLEGRRSSGPSSSPVSPFRAEGVFRGVHENTDVRTYSVDGCDWEMAVFIPFKHL